MLIRTLLTIQAGWQILTLMKKIYILIVTIFITASIFGALVSFPPPQASISGSVFVGNTINYGWTASPDTNVVGYRIYYGYSFGSRSSAATAGNVTNATLDKLEAGKTVFAQVVSYKDSGIESEPSNTTTNYVFPKIKTRVYIIAADVTAPNKTNVWQISENGVSWRDEKTVVAEVGSQLTLLVTNNTPMKLIRLK